MTHSVSEPAVLRSLKDLGADPAGTLPITQLGTTFVMCQDVSWIDLDHFAVGRWDGTLSVFNKTSTQTQGALITTALTTPSDQGVQMVEWIAPRTFVTSNDAQSMIVWQAQSDRFENISQAEVLSFPAAHGVANSADDVVIGGVLYLVTGHEAGFLNIWTGQPDGTGFTLARSLDLTSSKPVNPWGLQNIRGIGSIFWTNTEWYIATGSENGEICVIEAISGQIKSRTVFNPAAKRGINAVSTLGQNLLVANCSVGPSDKNLWYYWIDGNDFSVTLRQSVNLIVDTSRPQVFNFDVTWGMNNGQIVFFSATEEGVLWMGRINGSAIDLIGNQKVAVADLGAALASGVTSLAYVAYNVSGFDTNTTTADLSTRNPNRVLQSDAPE